MARWIDEVRGLAAPLQNALRRVSFRLCFVHAACGDCVATRTQNCLPVFRISLRTVSAAVFGRVVLAACRDDHVLDRRRSYAVLHACGNGGRGVGYSTLASLEC